MKKFKCLECKTVFTLVEANVTDRGQLFCPLCRCDSIRDVDAHTVDTPDDTFSRQYKIDTFIEMFTAAKAFRINGIFANGFTVISEDSLDENESVYDEDAVILEVNTVIQREDICEPMEWEFTTGMLIEAKMISPSVFEITSAGSLFRVEVYEIIGSWR